MLKRFPTLLSLVFVLSSCGGPPPEPPAPPPLDPTGAFSVTIDAQGMQVFGTLTIREAGEGYSGFIDTDMGGAAVADIVVEGDTVSFSVPDAGVDFEVVFEGDGFSGSFDGAMGAGMITGVKQESR